MRKTLIMLPCLLLSGMAAANTSGLQARHHADLLSAALDAGHAQHATAQQGSGDQLYAANKKKKAATPAKAPEPQSAPTDNSKRFLMTQNGKQMTADDFDAWMKKNGYRVATGAPAKPAEASQAEKKDAK